MTYPYSSSLSFFAYSWCLTFIIKFESEYIMARNVDAESQYIVRIQEFANKSSYRTADHL